MANFLNKIFQKNASEFDRKGFGYRGSTGRQRRFYWFSKPSILYPIRKKQTRILIRNGILSRKNYRSRNERQPDTWSAKTNSKPFFSFNNFASKPTGFGDQLGTSGSASAYISPANFSAENITFENGAGPVGQAVAVIVRSDKLSFTIAVFWDFRIRFTPIKSAVGAVLQNCYIEGTVDFIFGSSVAFFEECEIFCKNNGYVTAPSTPQTVRSAMFSTNAKLMVKIRIRSTSADRGVLLEMRLLLSAI